MFGPSRSKGSPESSAYRSRAARDAGSRLERAPQSRRHAAAAAKRGERSGVRWSQVVVGCMVDRALPAGRRRRYVGFVEQLHGL